MRLLSCCSLILIGLAGAAYADAPRPRAGGDTGTAADAAVPAPRPHRPRAGAPVPVMPTMVADGRCGRKYCSDTPASDIVAGTTVPAG
jgi:hypothetical protein